MKSFWDTRRVVYGLIILISAIIVFFIGNFRKWLDVSGGTRLMYRIAYDAYEQTYSGNIQALNEVKNTVENIILKNIDGRISKLWVSDYRSYIQQLNNETQIVVEIWWIADLDQAKEIIGKTVELEFKLPNENEWTEEEKAERENLAKNLYDDLTNNVDKFEAIAGSRQSENVYYTKYDKVTLSQLPTIYQDNLNLLNETQEWKVSPLMEGEYYSYEYQDNSGNVQNVDMDGYTFFHMISREQWTRDEISLSDILEVATELWATYDEKFTLVKEWTNINSGSYAIEWDVLKYNNGEVYPNEEAYDVRILAMIPEISVDANVENESGEIVITSDDENLGSDNENIINLDTLEFTGESTESVSEEVVESTSGLSDNVNVAKDALLANNDAEISGASVVYEGLLSLNDLKNSISSFDASNADKVHVYEIEWVTYLVVLKDKKSATDKWYNIAIVNWVNDEEFSKALESQTFYTMEEVFVQDKLTWKNAQSDKWDILNGANFKYASVSTSQLWQPVVVISFDTVWSDIFCNITSNNIGKEMAIFIWGEMITSPVIQAKICDGSAQIDGNFTADSAKELTNQLNNWALPAPLILMQEEKVSPTLWENALNGALLAMAIGFIAIWLYMTSMYGWKKWLISLISLSIYSLVLFALVKLFNYALSLSGIAAVILSLWMAVDANVLIFERMREEKENNKSDSEAINVAYDRSRNAIRDGQISTWMIGLLLWLMWINMFKWFGTMLVVWVLLTLLINAPVIKELLHIFYRKK